ncbi:MAG: extracellular solute-binding protein [Acidimicrobiales bacterium]|nr:extracellular solute-binding protein [Acidimicrobiales bacterium]
MLALLVTAAALAGCGGDDTNTATGKPGGNGGDEAKSFVLYTGRDEELIGPIIDAFEKESGVKVDVRYGNSAEMAAQLLEEGDSTPADAFLSQEVGAIGALADAGLLGDLPTATVERAEVRFRPVEGTKWVGVTARSRVIAYNPEMLDAAGVAVPTGVEDLTDPAYEGMVAMVPGNASFQAFITAFRITRGEAAAREWLEAMIVNGADTTFENNGDVLEAVNSGDVAIGLINHYYWARHENRDQLEVKLVFPAGDDPGGLVNATAIGVTKAGADNSAALAFADFLLSKEGQEHFVNETWEYPVVASVADPTGVPPLSELEGPRFDLADLDSLEQTQALLGELGLIG